MQSLSNAKYHRRRAIWISAILFVISQRRVQPTIVDFDLLVVEDDRFLRRQEVLYKRNALGDEVVTMAGSIGKVIRRFELRDSCRGLIYPLTIFGKCGGVRTTGNQEQR